MACALSLDMGECVSETGSCVYSAAEAAYSLSLFLLSLQYLVLHCRSLASVDCARFQCGRSDSADFAA